MKFPQGRLPGQDTNLLEQQCQRTQLSVQCTDQKPKIYNAKNKIYILIYLLNKCLKVNLPRYTK